jgi:hypothetical protein
MTILKTNLSLFIICALLLTSCLTAKKVDKQVSAIYGEKQQAQKKKQPDFISITSSLASTGDYTSTTVTKTSDVLPLVFYWSWDYKNTCTLNPQIPINNFTTTVLGMANKALKEKLNGQKIELSVDQIPNKFAFDDKAHLIFVIYAFGWDNVSIKAEKGDLVVSYKVFNNNSESKKGTITIPYFDDRKNLGMFTSWKKATSGYLDQYDANITLMSKLFVDKLIKEI